MKNYIFALCWLFSAASAGAAGTMRPDTLAVKNNATVGGTTTSTGNFKVGSSGGTFNVTAASGNTTVSGTLGVTGAINTDSTTDSSSTTTGSIQTDGGLGVVKAVSIGTVLGVGVVPNASRVAGVKGLFNPAGATNAYRLVDGDLTATDTSGTTASTINGGYFNPAILGTNTSNWTAAQAVNGITTDIRTNASATGTIAEMVGIYQKGQNSGSTTVTNFRGMKIDQPTNAGTITNLTGIAIADHTNGSNEVNLLIGTHTVPSGSWSIHNASTMDNAFAGNVRIGSVVAPTVALDVTGAVTASSVISAGSAVNGLASFKTSKAGVTINDNATSNFALTSGGAYGLLIVSSADAGYTCLFSVWDITPYINEINDPAGKCTITAASAGSINVYWASSGTYTVENKLGSNRTFHVMYIGNRNN